MWRAVWIDLASSARRCNCAPVERRVKRIFQRAPEAPSFTRSQYVQTHLRRHALTHARVAVPSRLGHAPMTGLRVALTVDFEPDCPPYLQTQFRGITEGTPALLALLRDAKVPATWFTTGEIARRFPDAVRAVVNAGHELGCHGETHRAFDTLSPSDAQAEIRDSAAILRTFASVESFRAPYLRFPNEYLPMLRDAGFTLDASLAKYKASYLRRDRHPPLNRIAASTTSSVLRLPRAVRNPWLLALADPVVLFVHPWEFVDLTRTSLRYDCRFRTGAPALRALRDVLTLFHDRGARFVPISALVPAS